MIMKKLKLLIRFFFGKYGTIYSFVNYSLSFLFYFKLYKKNKILFKKFNKHKGIDNEIILKLESDGFFFSNIENFIDKSEIDIYLDKIITKNIENDGNKKKFFHNLYKVEINDPIIHFCKSPRILNIASNYLGTVPLINSIQFIKSDENDKNYFSSMNWHLDTHHLKLLKIIYLPYQINYYNGPTSFMNKDQTQKILKKNIKFKLPSYFTDQEIFSNDIKSKNTTENFLGNTRGNLLFIDTSKCFHMGSRCEIERHQLFITYTPVLTYDLKTLTNINSTYKLIDEELNNSIKNIINKNY